MNLDEKNNIIIKELQIENKLLLKNQEKNVNYIKELENENRTMKSKLESIEYSRSYKFIQKIKKIINRR